MIRDFRSQPMNGPIRLLRAALAAVGTLVVLAPSDWAMAAWTSPGAGRASAASTSVPTGPQPVAIVVGRSVTLTWASTAMPGGDAVSAYRVRRWGPGGTATVGASCNTVQSGLSCTEAAVAPGTWSYAVAAVAGSWTGGEGASTPVVVPAPAFTLSAASAVTGILGTVTGSVSGFVGPAPLAFRLDDPTSGRLLTGTPTTVPTDGRADVAIMVPTGVTGGLHTIYAIGAGGDVVGAQVVVDATPPTPISIFTGDGGGNAGSAEAGDWLEATFSEPLRASSLCAAWTDDGTAKTLTEGVTVLIVNNGSLTATDLLSVQAPGCGPGGFRFGTLDLGAKGYVRNGSAAAFGLPGTSANVSWDPATSKLRIVLGAASTNRFGVVPSSMITYVPDPAITDLRGLGIVGSAVRIGRQL